MAKCDLIEKCIFFNDQMANMPGTAEMYKTSYCKGNYDKCARHLVYKALGRDKVPKDLYPNQHEKAQVLINSK